MSNITDVFQMVPTAIMVSVPHQRLRGWEVDDNEHDIKSCGRQYVLERSNLSQQQKVTRLHALVEGVGAKLRFNHKTARGVRIYARLYGGGGWQAHAMSPLPLYSDALARERHMTWAIDEINDRFGERTIHSGNTLEATGVVKTKIPFGSTLYM